MLMAWFVTFVDKRTDELGVHVKLCNLSAMRAIPERFRRIRQTFRQIEPLTHH